MLRTLILVALSGLLMGLSGFAQSNPCTPSNLDLRGSLLIQKELQGLLGPQWVLTALDLVPNPPKEAGICGTHLALFMTRDKTEKIEIRLLSFKDEKSASEFNASQLKQAEIDNAVIETDWRNNKDNRKTEEFNKALKEKVSDGSCQVTEVALVRARTPNTKDGFFNSIKLLLRYKNVFASTERANTNPQVQTPPSPDSRDKDLTKVAIEQTFILCTVVK